MVCEEWELNKMVQKIIDFNPNLLDNLDGNGTNIFLLCSRPGARAFLNQGVFLEIHKNEEIEWSLLFRKLLQEPKISNSKMKLINNTPTYKKDWTYYVFLIMAVLSFCYCLIDLIEGQN